MLIGDKEQSKTLEEAINFNKENIFEYIRYIQGHRNANFAGEETDKIIKDLNYYLDKNIDNSDIVTNILDEIFNAINQTSDYAYEAGFREGIRLIKTLFSF